MTPGQALGGTTIQLGTLLLGVVDDQNVRWTIDPEGLQGWDSPEVRYTSTDREGDNGAWEDPTYFGTRPVTITGKIEAPDLSTLDASKEALLAACSITDTTLVVNETLSMQATVRRSGKPIITKITDTVASFSLLVTSADSRRYDVNLQSASTPLPSTTGGLVLPATLPWTLSAVTVAGSIEATNTGTFTTKPVFTITGPVSQPQIAVLYPDGTVRSLTYTGPDLLAGDQLLIDTDAHTVTQGGASRRRWLMPSGGWPDLPPGSTAQIQFRAAAYSSTASLTAAWRSAWI